MAFQFQCPHCGNILQGEESQGGTQCQCPICHNAFIIPMPAAPASPAVFPGPTDATTDVPAIGPREPAPSVPQINIGGSAPPAPPPAAFETKDPDLLHIPCPECKEVLETPVEMLDQDVMCPHCQAQFRLRRRDSLEFKRKKKQELEIRERKASRAWLNWAIVAVILLLLFFGFLIFASSGWE
jgi:DNA-directed RNA polymerase subunit M/transcription elongation factor TFIIS